jgi:lysophospholipase L1-like esterase
MKSLVMMAAAVALSGCASLGGASGQSAWTGAWGASPTPPPATARTFEAQTIRQVMRVSTGGDRVRIRFTNEYSDNPLEIGAAAVTLAGADGKVTGSPVKLTFGGKPSTKIPPRAPMLSDPITLPVKALDNISISLFVPGATGPCTCHPGARADGFVSAPGDYTAGPFEETQTIANRAFISAIEVESAAPAIITFGDSITDGTASTNNANHRWPDILTERLVAANMVRGVSNQAIAGNRVLAYANQIFGESALTRFDRDVLSVPNARWMIVLEGINDVGMGGDARPSVDQMIAGYRQLIDRAHAKGIKVYGATLLPFEGARYATESGEVVRAAVNEWIRNGKGFDGVIDFDAVMKDPANPKKMKADLQSGDWLHPNDAGYKVMGDAVDLALFR